MLGIEGCFTISTYKSRKAKKKYQYIKICYKGYITYRYYYQNERLSVRNIANLCL